MPAKEQRFTSADEWNAEGILKFGPDQMEWRFVCPGCGHVASVQDWKNAGAPSSAVAFSCVGRWTEGAKEFGSPGPGPCNYAGGGLFRLNPVMVTGDHGKQHGLFEFADAER